MFEWSLKRDKNLDILRQLFNRFGNLNHILAINNCNCEFDFKLKRRLSQNKQTL